MLRQLAACSNLPGEEGAARVLAVYSDDYFRRNAVVSEQRVPAEDAGDLFLRVVGIGVARLVVVSYGLFPINGQNGELPVVEETRRVAGGRVLALVRASWGERLAIVFARDPDSGRYQFDEFGAIEESDATPAATSAA